MKQQHVHLAQNQGETSSRCLKYGWNCRLTTEKAGVKALYLKVFSKVLEFCILKKSRVQNSPQNFNFKGS